MWRHKRNEPSAIGLSSQRRDAGFSLVETMVAVFIAGTVIVAIVELIALSARVSVRQEESVTLTSLARAQIEAIQQTPFSANVLDYPRVSDLPEGVSINVSVSDPGIAYAYPDGSTLASSVQQVQVTAARDFSQVSITFYKVKMP